MVDNVLPGQEVKTDKRLGYGLYSEGGKTYASVVGDMKESPDRSFVEPENSIVEVKRGDTVICAVESVKDKVVLVKVLKVVGKKRSLPREDYGVIRVMDISSGYTDSAKDEFKIGDFIKAEVKQVLPNDIILTTKGNNLGVIEGYCSECRGILEMKDNKLVCNNCGKENPRKVSADYLVKEEA